MGFGVLGVEFEHALEGFGSELPFVGDVVKMAEPVEGLFAGGLTGHGFFAVIDGLAQIVEVEVGVAEVQVTHAVIRLGFEGFLEAADRFQKKTAHAGPDDIHIKPIDGPTAKPKRGHPGKSNKPEFDRKPDFKNKPDFKKKRDFDGKKRDKFEGNDVYTPPEKDAVLAKLEFQAKQEFRPKSEGFRKDKPDAHGKPARKRNRDG